MITRLARWWLNRKEQRAEPGAHTGEAYSYKGECICGAEVSGDDLHVVVALADDDAKLGIEGSTAMSADFCGEHCPGGCRLGCATIDA